MTDWVFFDVGNVLFDDDPQNFAAFRHYYHALRAVNADYSFADFLRDREELARTGATWIIHKIASRTLTEQQVAELYLELRDWLLPRYDDVHLVNEGLWECLDSLAGRYRLGIIANQPPECRNSLARREILSRFDVVAISEELDLHKPDRRIFEWSLEKAGCDAGRSVMIGDRRDNDVAPAKSLGMGTVWIRWPSSSAKPWRPTGDALAVAYLASCDKVPLFNAIVSPANEPDETVGSLREIPAAVDRILSRR